MCQFSVLFNLRHLWQFWSMMWYSCLGSMGYQRWTKSCWMAALISPNLHNQWWGALSSVAGQYSGGLSFAHIWYIRNVIFRVPESPSQSSGTVRTETRRQHTHSSTTNVCFILCVLDGEREHPLSFHAHSELPQGTMGRVVEWIDLL